MDSAFIGRQPIYTSNLEVCAYEVLFRSSQTNSAMFDDAEQATAQLILNLFIEIGLERVVGELPAFINMTENFILGNHAKSLPADRVVLEVLEDVRPQPEIVSAISELKDLGYKIALDDFIYSPEMQPLIALADIIKFEYPATARDDLAQHVELLRRDGVKLLAEKIETYEDFTICKDLGFDLFQGYFFCKPNVITGKRISVSRVAALRVLSELHDPDVKIKKLTNILSTEPSLCYKLLRFVNSAALTLTHRINTIEAAVTMMGLKRLHSLASLELLAKVAQDKPPHLIVTALTRGRMCELLAKSARRPSAASYFVAGLFSVLDAILDKPMSEALADLPLDTEIKDVLLTREGPMADILHCVVVYDQAEFDGVQLKGFDNATIRDAYLDALTWVAEVSMTAAKISG